MNLRGRQHVLAPECQTERLIFGVTYDDDDDANQRHTSKVRVLLARESDLDILHEIRPSRVNVGERTYLADRLHDLIKLSNLWYKQRSAAEEADERRHMGQPAMAGTDLQNKYCRYLSLSLLKAWLGAAAASASGSGSPATSGRTRVAGQWHLRLQ